jgi:outer membrane protein assembly factor BamB
MKRSKFTNAVLLLGLIILVSSGCKKQSNEKPDNTTKRIGEKLIQVGTYQTWAEVIHFAIDKGYVVAGTASNAESEGHPYLALIDDTLHVTKVLYPACNLNYASTQGLAKLSDGYVILSTYSGSQDNTYGVYLTKISITGNIIWEKEYLSGFSSWGPNITTDSDNSIIILCEQTLPPDYKFYSRIVKLDSDGNVLWSNDFFPDVLNQPETIITDHQENYIAIIDSITDHFGPGEDRVSVPVVHKISKDGTILWTKTLESDNGRGWSSRATADNDNNIIITHESQSQYVVLKLDQNGNQIWKSTITNDILDLARMREVIADNENYLYVIGDSKFQNRTALLRITPDGTVSKTKEYPTDGTVYTGNSIKYVPDKKVIVLSTRCSPYEASVIYMSNGFEIL